MAAPRVLRKCPCILANQCYRRRLRSIGLSCFSSDSNAAPSHERDPFPLYANHEVQTLLKRMTGFDLMKLAGPHMTSLDRPVYKLLTDDELDREKEATSERMSQLLASPPPYMNHRKPVKEPLAVDPDLAHFDTHKHVFTDISFGVNDRERSVVIREVDGTLGVAPLEVKERMNQIYNPREGRGVITPQMFDEEHLERLISEKKYVYILERACAQFEPDDPIFTRASHRVYSAINANLEFDILRSTRFFSPMVFHFAWTKMIDSLLIDMLGKDMELDAIDLVNLYCMTHPDGACSQGIKKCDQSDSHSVLKVYLETDAQMSSEVGLALQTLMDRKSEKKPSSLSS